MQTETIYGQIISKANCYQVVPDGKSGKRLIKNSKIRNYERTFDAQCKIYRNMGICTRFRLFALIWQKTKFFDLDNSIKTLLDCLQYVGAIKDDNLCTEIVARKLVDRSHPRVEFALEEIDKQLSLFSLQEMLVNNQSKIV